MSANEVRVDPLTGLKVIIARPAPAARAATSTLEPEAADRPRAGPVPPGPRGPHAARAVRAAAPAAARRTRPAGACASCPTSTRRSRPAATSRAAEAVPDLFSAQPRDRRPRGDRQRARRGHVDGRPLGRAGAGVAMEAWRERMRAHADAACVHVLVNEGREGGASLPHTHAQLYALDFVPAAIARERERFGAYATRTMGGNLLGRPRAGGGAPARAASWRSTTRRCCWRRTRRGSRSSS